MKNFALITERLELRCFTLDDAPVVLDLLNEPTFKKFVGDKGIHTLDDARDYLRKGPMASYQDNGFGAYLVLSRPGRTPVGMCGLFKRENLEHPDLGFAFFSRSFGKGLAFESSQAVIDHARDSLRIPVISAASDPENSKSTRLLDRLGFCYKKKYCMPNETKKLNYYEMHFSGDQ